MRLGSPWLHQNTKTAKTLTVWKTSTFFLMSHNIYFQSWNFMISCLQWSIMIKAADNKSTENIMTFFHCKLFYVVYNLRWWLPFTQHCYDLIVCPIMQSAFKTILVMIVSHKYMYAEIFHLLSFAYFLWLSQSGIIWNYSSNSYS